MNNYDLAVCMDESTHNRVLAALFAKPGLRSKLFSGSESAQESGVEVTIGFEALESPVVSLNPPTDDQWKTAIKEDGKTPQPAQNAFTINFPQMFLTRTEASGRTAEATIPLTVICTIAIRDNKLAIDPVAAMVDVSHASKLDQLLYKKVIVPKMLKMADGSMTDEQIPDFNFQGIRFGGVALGVGNGRMVSVANLEGKGTPSAPSLGDFPDGAFYILLSREALQKVTDAGTQALKGRTGSNTGGQDFEIGRATYDATLRVENLSGGRVNDDFNGVSAKVAVSITASAGISMAEILAYQARRAAEIAAEETKRAAERAAEESRRAAEIAAAETRRTMELAQAEAKRAAERAAEETRRAAEIAAEETRRAAERAAEETRRAAERAAEEARRAAEKTKDFFDDNLGGY